MSPSTAARFPKHAATLAWARKQIGKREVPLGSNTGRFVVLCQRATWLGGTQWPWCRAFNLKARKTAGDRPGDGSAGAWDALERARLRGEALARGDYKKAIPGDEVIWAFGAGHASILVRVTKARMVVSVDGNVSDRVKECTRPLSLVKGFIHWPEKPVGALSRPKPPRSQVVGSATGRRKLVTRKGKVIALPAKRRVDVEVDGRLILKGQSLDDPAVKRRLPRLIGRAKGVVTIRRRP